MNKKFLSIAVAAILLLLSVGSFSADVFAAESAAPAPAAGEEKAAGEDLIHSGDLVDYLGTDGEMVKTVFNIQKSNATPDGGMQLWAEDDTILFQTGKDGKVEYINLLAPSPFWMRGVTTGMSKDTVKSLYTAFGWKEKLLPSVIGDLWTFYSPDGYSATVLLNADGTAANIAVTKVAAAK